VGVVHYTDFAATTSFATLGTTLGITSAELRRRTRRRRRRPRPLLGDPNTRDLNPSNLTTKEMRDASR